MLEKNPLLEIKMKTKEKNDIKSLKYIELYKERTIATCTVYSHGIRTYYMGSLNSKLYMAFEYVDEREHFDVVSLTSKKLQISVVL